MKFARIVFLIAGIYGIVVIAPQYFLEQAIAQQSQHQIYHPEYFYGFLGVTLAWQIVFLIIATNPPRYRPIMYAACVEKLGFGVAIPILYLQNRVSLNMVAAACIDLVLLTLFAVSIYLTARTKSDAVG